MRTGASRSNRTFLVAARLVLAGGLAAQTAQIPDLTGRWQLSKDMSDDPEKVMKEARSSEGGGGYGAADRAGWVEEWGWATGTATAAAVAVASAEDPGDAGRQDMSNWFAAFQTLQIQHRGPMLAITDAFGRERVAYTDGRKTQEERSHGGTTVVTASWKDGHIQVVSTPETGPKVTETFAVTADGSQLTVTTKMEGEPRPAITIRRVYDSVEAGAPKPAPAPPAPAPGPVPPGGSEEDQSV